VERGKAGPRQFDLQLHHLALAVDSQAQVQCKRPANWNLKLTKWPATNSDDGRRRPRVVKKISTRNNPKRVGVGSLCATFTRLLDIDIVNIHRRHQQLLFFLDRPEVVVVAPRG
jgi:hypothetical protein